MLLKCKECDLQVSDKAISCPHCGCPTHPDVLRKRLKKSKKRLRLPNGFGQISKINDVNMRNQYRAMVTVGKNSTGRPICKPLKPNAYFHTYNEAYAALVAYNQNPYDLEVSITVKDLYEKWCEQYFKTLKVESSCRTIISAWSYCSSVYDMRASDLRARHIKGCMDEGFVVRKGKKCLATVGIKGRIKSLFNLMLDYALEYELVDRNYARTFNVSDETLKEVERTRKGHLSFKDEEMKILWNEINSTKYVDIILIQCYSGWRPQELGLIELEDVNLNDWTFVGGMKSDAGENRIVPIHSKIRHLVEEKYNEAKILKSKYLLNCPDARTHRNSIKLTYDKYAYRFKNVKNTLKLNPEHRPHDPRKHFVTMAKKYKIDEYAIKYMVGHSITDITEKIYTDRDVDWLKTEIEKIK
jgi:Integrase